MWKTKADWVIQDLMRLVLCGLIQVTSKYLVKSEPRKEPWGCPAQKTWA